MDKPDGADLEHEHCLLESAGPEGQLIGAEGGRCESQAQTARKNSASRRSVGQDFPLEEDMTKSCRDKYGRWINPWPTWRFPSVFTLAKFLVWDKDNSNVPESEEVLDKKLPVLVPYFAGGGAPDGGARCSHGDGVPGRGLRVTWLGHATTLVELDGLNVLTDPIFSQRASPSQLVGPKRYRGPPCTVEQLPRIDAVVISHSHFDHLDAGTVGDLNARFGAALHWFVPLGLSDWLARAGCRSVTELDWWERSCVPGHEDTAFVCTPAQHWSKRTPLDHNKALWGSWCVLGPHHKFFFAGDTGYCSSFAEIGRHFGPFDLAAIPIGAYRPRHVMVGQHVDPEQAVKIHVDVRAKHSLAIHWGTFALAHEHYLEPPQLLREALEQKALQPGSFFTLHHGESWSAGPTGGGACH